MKTLTILRADGSRYWTEDFNDMDSADAWLAEEQTRPYWDPGFTFSIVDHTSAPLPADPLAAVRARRNALLSACDWTQLADCPISSAKKSAWATYRQALRDLPDQPGLDLSAPSWPMPPGPVG